MAINAAALTRLRESHVDGDRLSRLFQLLSRASALQPDATLSFTVRYQQIGDPIEEGDLIPVLTLSLQPAVTVTPLDANDPGPDSQHATGATEQ